MQQVIFQNAMRIIRQVMDWLQSSEQLNDANRINDYSQSGIVKNLLGEFTISAGGNNTHLTPSISIGAGVAYDSAANRVTIPSGSSVSFNSANPSQTTNDGNGVFVPTPQSTGNINVPLNFNSQNYVWITYLGTVDTSVFTLNAVNNGKQFYKQLDGYRVTITTTFVAPFATSVFLGTVDLTGSADVSPTTISQGGRTYTANYPYRTLVQTALLDKSDATVNYPQGNISIFADDHVKALGHGVVSNNNPHGLAPEDIGLDSSSTVTNHQMFFHTSAIQGSSLSTTSSLFGFISTQNPGFDFMTIQGLSSNEEVNLNGTTISSFDVPAPTGLFFTNLDPTGTWYFYLDGITFQVLRTQANLVTTPDPNKYLLYSADYNIVGPHGILNNLIDYRQIGSIASRNVEDDAAAWIFSKIDSSDRCFENMAYNVGGLDDGLISVYDKYGNDDADHLESLIGTVTFTNGSTAVTGVSTDFSLRITGTAEGITDASRGTLGVVASVTDDFNLVLTQPWTGPNTVGTAIRFKYHIRTTYSYQNDPVLGGRRLGSSTSTFRFGAINFVRTTFYSYDPTSGLLISTVRA